MAQAKLIGAYMEPREVVREGVTELFDRFQHETSLRTMFFRAYEFYYDREAPGMPCAGQRHTRSWRPGERDTSPVSRTTSTR